MSATASATTSCTGRRRSFDNFRVVPPGTGICHQVNLEYLSQTVWTQDRGRRGTSPIPTRWSAPTATPPWSTASAVLGWGVGGIEAEAAMLGQPISMLIPEVIGFRITGKLREGVTATDLVLTVTEMLRKKGVVGKFVEFFGPGLDDLALEDRATIGNMAPEYGATCGFFPVDGETLRYLTETGRDPDRVALVEAYAKAQGMFRTPADARPGVHRHARTRSRHRRAVARRAEAAAGPRSARPAPKQGFATALSRRVQARPTRSRRASRSKARTSISATATW